MMSDHKTNRNSHILSDLVGELFGPSHYHKDNFGTKLKRAETSPLDIKQKKIIFHKGWEQVRESVYTQEDTGEEILSGKDSPSVRYSIGILFPQNFEDTLHEDDQNIDEEDLSDELTGEDNNRMKLKSSDSESEINLQEDGEQENIDLDYDLTASNQMLQSSAGLSFCINEEKLNSIQIKATGGIYKPLKNIEVIWEKNGEPKTSKPIWWARENFEAEFKTKFISNNLSYDLEPIQTSHEDFNIGVKIYKKNIINSKANTKDTILTVVLLNNNEATNRNTDSLFQTYFEVIALDDEENSVLEPYPQSHADSLSDKDGEMLKKMYSSKKIFAIGHGISADWSEVKPKSNPEKIFGSFLPVYEIPSISPDVKASNNEPIAPEMELLSSENSEKWSKGLEQLTTLIQEYEHWIDQLVNDDTETASRMIAECEEALRRMRDGYDLLHENKDAAQVFKWMNEAMLKQQERPTALRQVLMTEGSRELYWGEYPKSTDKKGKWRAFQIAFVMMNLRSIVEPNNRSLRDNVELIWFPTGGGKTEAYFGLAAFSILWRRLNNPSDDGTEVIMRYTLRLLTTQQYQRASSLICALDLLREENIAVLGTKRITLGLWIGGESSPNNLNSLQQAWRDINNTKFRKNKFVINQCPWCGAEMGIPRNSKAQNHTPLGYSKSGSGVDFKINFFCPDANCDFNLRRGLPLFVDDTSIYRETPSMIIGTIDKLAMLAFNSGSKNFPVFGRQEDGSQTSAPPGLIIQDELHLISGPLGSISGLWECVIENFCTNFLDPENPIKPKIVCSTATIRKYEEQILGLYGRTSSTLFPPPGLDAADSFFGKEISEKGSGKLYVGVLTPSIGSPLVAQTRVFTTLLQSPVDLPTAEEKDPWHTLMLFFNSIRELGGAETLFQTDIPDYLGAYKERYPNLNLRYPNNRIRLTGELSNDELPVALEELEKTTSADYPVDVCLATNILEVGVDISRLSLMTVVGQPKTTATYIQATGRVGRDKEKPGLVVTIYSPFKPRDRSHYEKFRTYHETLYSQVEPTSVTPFSAPSLEKALHATFVSFIKLKGNRSIKDSPENIPEDLIEDFLKLMEGRAEFIYQNQEYKDPDLVKNFKKIMQRRILEWKKWQSQDWEFETNRQQVPLLVRAGTDETATGQKKVWPTMMNMRSVDATCKLKITDKYILDEDY